MLRCPATSGLSGPRFASSILSAAHERFGLGEPVCAVQQAREIIQVHRYIGMIRPVARLINLECAAKERFGFGEPVRGVKQAS